MKGRTVMNLISWLLMLSFLLTGCAPPAQDLVANPSAGKPQQVVTENQSTSGTENGVVPEMDRSGGHQVETEELTIESEGGSIYAVLYRPIGEETPRPTVIFSHGYGDTNRGGSRYAQTLARQGYLVCCFDFRGGGPGSQSDGSNLDMTIFTEQFDLETVLDALRQRDDVDSGNLFLLGNSQGGVVSAITAAVSAIRDSSSPSSSFTTIDVILTSQPRGGVNNGTILSLSHSTEHHFDT